jgi:hypothetical protein
VSECVLLFGVHASVQRVHVIQSSFSCVMSFSVCSDEVFAMDLVSDYLLKCSFGFADPFSDLQNLCREEVNLQA